MIFTVSFLELFTKQFRLEFFWMNENKKTLLDHDLVLVEKMFKFSARIYFATNIQLILVNSHRKQEPLDDINTFEIIKI